MKTRLIACVSENIGQMPDYMADKEVDRLIAQTGNQNWHKDYSDELYCPDETDDEVYNPCPRAQDHINLLTGEKYVYCWVTCSNNVVEVEE